MTHTEQTEARIRQIDFSLCRERQKHDKLESLARELAAKLDAVSEEINDYPPPENTMQPNYACRLAARIRAILEGTPEP